MCEFPYYRRYARDILADCRHLSRADYGSYSLILDTMWLQDGARLRFIPAEMARIAGVTLRHWQEVWGRLARFFTVSEDGLWLSQKRMTAELDAARGASGKQREKASKRWSRSEKKPLTMMEIKPTTLASKPLINNNVAYAAASPPARATPEAYKESLDENGKCSAREGRAMPQPGPDERHNRAVVEERFAKGFHALSQSLDAVVQEAALKRAQRKSREQPAEEAAPA